MNPITDACLSEDRKKAVWLLSEKDKEEQYRKKRKLQELGLLDWMVKVRQELEDVKKAIKEIQESLSQIAWMKNKDLGGGE